MKAEVIFPLKVQGQRLVPDEDGMGVGTLQMLGAVKLARFEFYTSGCIAPRRACSSSSLESASVLSLIV